MLHEGLYELLAGTSAVTSIVGLPAARKDGTTGIFQGQAPEEADVPLVVISQVAGDSLMTMDGPEKLRFVRMQFTCYGRDFQDAKQLQRAVRQTLESFTGTLGEGTQVDNMQSVLEMDAFEESAFLFSAPVDLAIAFRDLGS